MSQGQALWHGLVGHAYCWSDVFHSRHMRFGTWLQHQVGAGTGLHIALTTLALWALWAVPVCPILISLLAAHNPIALLQCGMGVSMGL